MAKDEVMIEPGMEVVTVDLMKNPKLNGMRGRVIGFEKPPNSGQLAVVVHFGKEAMMMFHHNLQAVPNSKIEMRIDEADGALYTLDEFKEFYAEEGIKKWKVSKTFEMKEPLYSAPYTGPAPKPKPKGKAAKPKPKGKAEKPKPKGKAAKPKPKGKKARAAAAAAAEEEDEPEESEPPSPPPRSPRSPKPKPKPKGKKAAAKAAAKAAPKPKPKAKAAKPAPKAAKKKKEPEPEPEPEVEEEEPEVEPEEEEAPQPEEEPEVEEEPEPEAEPEAEAEPEEAPPEADEEEAAAEPEEPEEAEPEAEPEPERAATPDPPQEEDEKEADKEAPTPPQEPPSPAPSSPQGGGGGGGEGDDGEDAAAASTSKRSEGEGAPDANDAAEAEAAAAAAAAAGEDVASNKADTASPRAGGDGGDDARSVASKASKGGGDDAKSMEASGRSQDTAAARSQVSEGGAPITKTDKLKETPSGGSGLARTASQASADPSLKKSASVVSVAASKASEKSAAVSKPASVASLSRKDSAASAATQRTAASSSAKPVKERSPSLVSSSGHSSVAGGGASPDTATLPQPKHSADAAAAELFNDSLTSFRTGGGGSIPSLPSAFKPDPNPAQQLPPSTAAAPAPAPAAAAVPEAAPGHKLADPLVRRAYLTQHLERFYQKHHPAKAPQAWAIGGRAINREDDLYKKLAIRYPTAISDLSFILTAVDANAAYLGSKERSGKRARRLSKKSVTAPDSILSDEGSQASLDSDRSASSSSAGGFSSSDDGGVAGGGGGGAATKVVHRPGRPKIELDLSKYRQRYSSNPFNNAKRTEAEVVAANEAAAKEARSGFSGDAGAASNPRSASSSMPYRSSRGIGVSFDLPMHHFEQPAEQRAAPAARRTSERREGRSASGRSSGSGAHHRQQQPPLPSEPPPLHILQQSFESNLSPPHARPPPPPPPSVPHAVYSPQPSRGVTQPSGPSRAVPAYIDHAPMGGMTSEEEELDELIAQVEAEEAGMRKIAEAARASTAASQAAVRRAARTSPPKRGAHAHPGSRPAAVAAPERRLPQPPSHPPPQRFEVPEPQQKRHGVATVTAALQSVSQQAPYPHGDAYASHGDGGEDDELSDLERQIAREEAYIQSLTAKKMLLKQQRGAAWPQQQQQQRASPARGLAPPPLAPSLTASPLPSPPPPAALHAERQLPTTPGGAFDAAVDSFLQTVDEEEDMGQPPSEAAPQMASSGGAPVAYTSSYSTEVAQIAQLNTMIHQMVQQQAVLEEQVGLAAATTPGAHPQLQSAGLSPLHAAAPAPAPLLADAALPYAHKKALAVAATPPPPPPPAAALVATPAAASVSHTVQRLRYESDFLARQQLDMLAAQRAELDRLETYASPAPNTH